MPIYEYRCPHCRTRFSTFYPSIAAAEAAGPARCPRCGSIGERRFSRIAVLRTSLTSEPAESWDDETMADEQWDEEDDFPLPEDDNPQALAQWARQLAAETGEPLDPLLDQALTDLERGADPDTVMERLDRAMEEEADQAETEESHRESEVTDLD